MLALVWRFVTRPHLERDLECLLQPLEPFRHRWVGDAEAAMLVLIPGGADAEVRTSTGENVERRGRLDQDSRVAVGDASDHGAEPDPRRASGGKCQRRPALEHVELGRSDDPDLEEVVHDPQAGETGALGAFGDQAATLAEERGATRPGEVGNLQTNAHGNSFNGGGDMVPCTCCRRRWRTRRPRAVPLPLPPKAASARRGRGRTTLTPGGTSSS